MVASGPRLPCESNQRARTSHGPAVKVSVQPAEQATAAKLGDRRPRERAHRRRVDDEIGGILIDAIDARGAAAVEQARPDVAAQILRAGVLVDEREAAVAAGRELPRAEAERR